MVLLPPSFVAVSRIEYVPVEVNVWDGSLDVENSIQPPPVLYSHVHEVGFPVDSSVNWTVSGAVPVVGDAVNAAIGAGKGVGVGVGVGAI